MASAVPVRDQVAVTTAATREAYRRAHELTLDLAELLGHLDARPDPSETIHLHESARLAVGTIVRLLAPAGAVPSSLQESTDPADLDAWVRLLDDVLTEGQAGDDVPREGALAVAVSIAVGIDRIAGVEGR